MLVSSMSDREKEKRSGKIAVNREVCNKKIKMQNGCEFGSKRFFQC